MTRWCLHIAAGLACAAGLAACGSSGQQPSSAATAADNALKFARCMREHGIKDFPDPEVSGGHARFTFKALRARGASAPNPRTLEAAQKACRQFRAFGQRHLSPKEQVERQEQVRKFAACMREHGVKLQTSTAEGGAQIRIGGPGGGGPNPQSPAFQRAQKACVGLLPFKGRGGAGTSSGRGGGAGLAIGG